jgi:hypothetical protein
MAVKAKSVSLRFVFVFADHNIITHATLDEIVFAFVGVWFRYWHGSKIVKFNLFAFVKSFIHRKCAA